MKAVVIGATGATGKTLVTQLLAHASVREVVVLVRKPMHLNNPKLKEIIVQFDQLDNWSSAIQGDVAFSCMGTTLRDAGSQAAQYTIDFEYQYQFAKLARANHIPSFLLVSSTGANYKSTLFYPRIKGELERAITQLQFPSAVFFRPGPLVRPESNRTGEKVSVAVLRFVNKLGLFQNMAPLQVADLASLMIRYALQPPAGTTIVESKTILSEIRQ